MNFRNVTNEDIGQELMESAVIDYWELAKKTFDTESELELIESYAEENNLIASERELSELFDEEVAPYVVQQYGADDIDAMNESFNNWSDMMCKDGDIHELQYNNYGYVGKYSND